jgi:hypothetical protein
MERKQQKTNINHEVFIDILDHSNYTDYGKPHKRCLLLGKT